MLEHSLVILNANIITLNSRQPRAEAIAIKNNRIVDVGSNRAIRKHINKNTKVVDAKTKTILPGLVDCHAHMASFGGLLHGLNLTNTKSIRHLQERLKVYANRNRDVESIVGRRWDQENFTEKRYPTRKDLDLAVADRPVLLTRVCGHLAVVNSLALKKAGITRTTNVGGGTIDLDNTGQPNGIVREKAIELIYRVIPKPSLQTLEEMCIRACSKAVEAGLTGVHWTEASRDELLVLQKLHSERKLTLRVYFGIPVDHLEELRTLGLLTGFGDDMLKIGFIKILSDGSLGARTASLKEPYSDQPETCGMMLYTQQRLNQLVGKAHAAGFQLAIHAIGDHAMESVLNAYEKTLEKHPRDKHRHRIEHCSVLNPDLIEKMRKLKLIASVQPHFTVSDFWTIDRVGKERARWTYPFKSLMKKGIVVTSSSDCPVEDISPILGIWAAVDRQDNPAESLTVEEALNTYTINAAYASFDEDKKGTIEPGKLADLTIISEDPTSISREKIKDIRVEMVIVDGKIVYHRE